MLFSFIKFSNPTGSAVEIADPYSSLRELSVHIRFTWGRIDIEVGTHVDVLCLSQRAQHTQAWDTSYYLLPEIYRYCLLLLILPFFIMDVANLFFTGELVHIVGTNIGDRGRSCSLHTMMPCGTSLRVDDWVKFRLVQLDNEGLHEDAIEVRRIVQGVETCRVGFLQRTYVPHFERYVNKFAQVREVWSAEEESKTKRYMFHHNHGCCIAGMMGPTKVAGVNDTSYDAKEESDNTDDDESE